MKPFKANVERIENRWRLLEGEIEYTTEAHELWQTKREGGLIPEKYAYITVLLSPTNISFGKGQGRGGITHDEALFIARHFEKNLNREWRARLDGIRRRRYDLKKHIKRLKGLLYDQE